MKINLKSKKFIILIFCAVLAVIIIIGVPLLNPGNGLQGTAHSFTEDEIRLILYRDIDELFNVESCDHNPPLYTAFKDMDSSDRDVILLVLRCQNDFNTSTDPTDGIPEEQLSSLRIADIYTGFVNGVLNKNYTVEELCGPEPSSTSTPVPTAAPTATPAPVSTPTPTLGPVSAQLADDMHSDVQYRMFAASGPRRYQIDNSSGEYYTSELIILPKRFSLHDTVMCAYFYVLYAQYPDLGSLLGNDFISNTNKITKSGNLYMSPPFNNANIWLSESKPDTSDGQALFAGDINYEPVDFSRQGAYTVGQIILAKGIDEEDAKSFLLPCDGRILSIEDYWPLYSFLSTGFGGNGETTFALPDYSKMSVPIAGAKYYICTQGMYPVPN